MHFPAEAHIEDWQLLAFGVVCALIIIIGILGNVFVIAVICRTTKMLKVRLWFVSRRCLSLDVL